MRKTLNVLAIVITTIVVTFLATIAYLHLTNTKVADSPLVVPKETISALRLCITTDTCLVPGSEIGENEDSTVGVGVGLEDNHGEILFVIKYDGTLIIQIESRAEGTLSTIEDSGTGTVEGYSHVDSSGTIQFIKPGDEIFKSQFGLIQQLYLNAMKEAEKAIIPPPKTLQPNRMFV